MVYAALFHVAFLFLLCLASTFPWWAAAALARAEYRRLLSALACSMRIFCYSICILCILVALLSLNLAPEDPRSALFGWIHLGGTLFITIPSAWRSFRAKGARLLLLLLLGWALSAALFGAAWALSPGFRHAAEAMPRVLSRR
ncbi:MAG TPA: hypothetical protein VFY93_13060 [Planctomycetota bacterium]|nr:hypothetical protein [Planctomycetota bacterium]